jgi:ribosomal protein S10
MRRSDSKDFVLDRFQMRIHSRSILTLRKCVEQLMHGS